MKKSLFETTHKCVICKGDIEIKITGLKPGEKVHEELYINKNITSTKHPKIFRVNENNSNHIDLEEKLKELQINLLDNRIENVKKIIFDLATQN